MEDSLFHPTEILTTRMRSSLKRTFSISLLGILFVSGLGCARLSAQNSQGISKQKPTTGRYVKIKDGFMVPFSVTIPGSEVTFDMVPIPGGMFSMRTYSKDGKRTVKSRVVVNTEPCWLGKCEVSWAEYAQYQKLNEVFAKFEKLKIREVARDNEIDCVTAPSLIYDPDLYYPIAKKTEWPKHPAGGMTQFAAKQYTKWLSKLTGQFYRLPTEAEWEHACRAGTSTKYCFGNDEADLGDYAWFEGNSKSDTHPVGIKKGNAWGLHDMHGNVQEWVLDQYADSYEPLRKAAGKSSITVLWPDKIHPRVVRGGSWDSPAINCQSSSREGSAKEWHDDEPNFPVSPVWLALYDHSRQIGFRIVRPLNVPNDKEKSKYWDTKNESIKKALEEYRKNGYLKNGLVDQDLPKAIEALKK